MARVGPQRHREKESIQILTELHDLHQNKSMCIANYSLLHVLMIFWRKFPEECDNAETCGSQIIHRL